MPVVWQSGRIDRPADGRITSLPMSFRAELSPWDDYQKAISADGRLLLELRLVADRGDPREEVRSARPRVTDVRMRRVILDLWSADCDAIPHWPAEGGLMLVIGLRRIAISANAQSWSIDNGEWRPIESLRAEDILPSPVSPVVPRQPPSPKEPRKAHPLFVLLAALLLAALLAWAVWDTIHGRGRPGQWTKDPDCKYGECTGETNR